MGPEYENWDSPARMPPARSGDYESWDAGMEPPQQTSTSKEIAGTIGRGAAVAGGAWGAGRALKWAFPALGNISKPRASLLSIDRALKKDFGNKGLKEMFPEYMGMVYNSGKPLTFADFLALKSERAPHTMQTINTMIDTGGNPNKIATELGARGEKQRGRVMEMLAKELGVPKETLMEGEEALKTKRRDTSKPLYEAAFKDQTPTQDSNLLAMLNKGAMLDAIKEGEELARLEGRGFSTRYASNPTRRDAWKRLLTSDVPEELFTGPEAGKLREYISPNIEELHNMRESLWNSYSKYKVKEPTKAGKYLDSWKELTKYMDDPSKVPPAYGQARRQYKADSDVLSAHEMGSELFKQNPQDLNRAMLNMTDDERAGLARGFYGSLMEMNDPKFIREVVGNSPQYAKQRELLGAVFPDKGALNDFLKSLEGEQAMLAGEKAFRKPGSPGSSNNMLTDNFKAIVSSGASAAGAPRAGLFSSMHMPPYDPTGSVPARGADILFGRPKGNPLGGGLTWTHPSGSDMFNHTGPDVPQNWYQRARQTARAYPYEEVAVPGGLGAVAGAYPYAGIPSIPAGESPEELNLSPLQGMP